MAKAIESQGVVIKVSTGSPTAFASIGNVTGIKGPGGSASVIDVTNLDSTTKEKLMGLPDERQVTMDINYDPDNATHTTLRAARRARTRCEFQITLTDATNTVLTFFGYVLGFSMDIALGQSVKAAVTIDITGLITDSSTPAPVWATFDPAAKSARITLSNGNLTETPDGTANNQLVKANVYHSSGKRYCEFTIGGYSINRRFGLANASASVDAYLGVDVNGYSWVSVNPWAYYHNGPLGTNGSPQGAGGYIGVLFDADAGTLAFSANGVVGTPLFTGITGLWTPAISDYQSTQAIVANFGASAWVYAPPAGYVGWSS